MKKVVLWVKMVGEYERGFFGFKKENEYYSVYRVVTMVW
jgi:hypothetical protein